MLSNSETYLNYKPLEIIHTVIYIFKSNKCHLVIKVRRLEVTKYSLHRNPLQDITTSHMNPIRV